MQCIYSDVLLAFPDLYRFFEKKESTVYGVGDKVTKVLGMLVNVPLHLGAGVVAPSAIVHTTFRVLDAKGYNIILGRQFLSSVKGVIDLPRH